MEKDDIYKQHILDCIGRIEQYVEGINRDRFETDAKTQAAVVRELEIIGEAAKRLSAEFKVLIPAIPWKQVTGTRDRLIHDYISVDLDEVWNITNRDLPVLKQKLQ